MSVRDELIREYVRCENIAAFTRQLQVERDVLRRKLLQSLLSEHEAPSANPRFAAPQPLRKAPR